MVKIKGREMQTQRQHNDVLYEEKIEVLGVKPLRRPPSGQ